MDLEQKYGLAYVSQSLKLRTSGEYEQSEIPNTISVDIDTEMRDSEIMQRYNPGLLSIGQVLSLTKSDKLLKSDNTFPGNVVYMLDKFGITIPVFLWWVDGGNGWKTGWCISDATYDDVRGWRKGTRVLSPELI